MNRSIVQNAAALLLLGAVACGGNANQASPNEPLAKSEAGKSAAQTASAAPKTVSPADALAAAAPGFAGGGTNPRFATVASHLDTGGSFYLFIDLKDLLREFVAGLKSELTDGGMQQVVPFLNIVDTEIEKAGGYGIEGLGMSVLKEDDGLYLTKSFLNAPEERKGLFKILGGAPHPFDAVKMAPKDTLLFADADFDYAEGLTFVKQAVLDVMGVVGATQTTKFFDQAKMQTGVDLEATIRSLAGETIFIATQDPSRKATLGGNYGPDEPPKIDLPMAAIGFKVKDATLYEALKTLAEKGGVAEPEETIGAQRRFAVKLPPNPNAELLPMVAFDGGICWLTTDKGYLERIQKTALGGENISASPEFIAAGKGLPADGNSLLFMSQKLAETLQSVMDASYKLAQAQAARSGQNNSQAAALGRMFSRLRMQPGPVYSLRINLPDGIQSIQRSKQGGRQAAAVLGVVPVAILAAIAVPNFLEARDRAEASRVRSDLRSLATALESYKVDSGAYPEWSADPKANAFGEKAAEVPGLLKQPAMRTETGHGGPASLTTPVAYIGSLPADPFIPLPGVTFSYWTPPGGKGWILWSPGPDKDYDIKLANVESLYSTAEAAPSPELLNHAYDPTNGAASNGDIFMTAPAQ